MREEVWNSFRLIGYKINELPNGYFIVKRPDENRSLFDNDGNVVITKCSKIIPLSKFYYNCMDEKGNERLVNKYGEIVDSGEGTEIQEDKYCIKVTYWHKGEIDRCNVYEKQGKAMFKDVRCAIHYIRVQNGKYSLIVTDKDEHLGSIDTDGNYTQFPIKVTYNPVLNNHYVQHSEGARFSIGVTTDYEGNVIDRYNNYSIDTTSVQRSDFIFIDTNDNKVKIIDKDKQLITSIDINKAMEVNFTTEANILSISTSYTSEYLLDICTKKESQEYRHIYKDEFIGEQSYGNEISLVLLDRNTLEPIARIDNLTSWEFQSDMIVTIREVDSEYISQNYTLDFRELIQEFELEL